MLSNTTHQLRNTHFHTITDIECYQAIDDDTNFNHTIARAVATIKFIQDTNTIFKDASTFSAASTHPWANDKELIKLRKFRKNAKKYYERSPNLLKRAFLKLANVELTKRYRIVKLDYYYQKVINNSAGDRRQLYTLLSKKRNSTSIPRIMTLRGMSYIIGKDNISHEFIQFFRSCYTVSM